MRTSAGWLVVLALLGACTTGDDDQTEVAGVVLDAEDADDVAEEPLVLGAETSELGSILGFGEAGVELGGHGPIDTDPASVLVADVIEQQDGLVSCRATLQAPDDRPLDAHGQLRVDLMREYRSGDLDRTARQIINLQVELDAGQRHEFPVSDPFAIDADELSGVWCEATHAPG